MMRVSAGCNYCMYAFSISVRANGCNIVLFSIIYYIFVLEDLLKVNHLPLFYLPVLNVQYFYII